LCNKRNSDRLFSQERVPKKVAEQEIEEERGFGDECAGIQLRLLEV
jgi:hypothetical protein